MPRNAANPSADPNCGAGFSLPFFSSPRFPPQYNFRVKRLLHLLRNTVLILSLLLCLAAIIMWPRSYYIADGISHGRNAYSPDDGSLIRRIHGIESNRGHVQLGFGHFSSLMFKAVSPRDEGTHVSHASPPLHESSGGLVWSHVGFAYKRWDTPGMLSLRALTIPYWSIILLFAIAPALWLIKRLLRSRRLSSNRCPTCGYDMRATPSRCPECGTPAPPNAPTARVTISP